MPLKRTLTDLANEARAHGAPEVDIHGLGRMRAENPKTLVIDVRESDERARGYVPDSVSIPRGVLERDIEKKGFGGRVSDEDLVRPIVCYCGGGSRSLLAAESLRKMGFTDVYSLAGGFGAWGKAGKEVKVDR